MVLGFTNALGASRVERCDLVRTNMARVWQGCSLASVGEAALVALVTTAGRVEKWAGSGVNAILVLTDALKHFLIQVSAVDVMKVA
jgi:hypothetical protein